MHHWAYRSEAAECSVWNFRVVIALTQTMKRAGDPQRPSNGLRQSSPRPKAGNVAQAAGQPTITIVAHVSDCRFVIYQ